MKALNLLILFVLTGFFFITNACVNIDNIEGSGVVVSEKREVSNFNGIKASTGLIVYITLGDIESLEIKADDNIVKLIKSEVKNGVLHISCEKSIKNAKSRNVYITAKNIKSIEGSAGVEIKSTSLIKSEKLSLSASSGASVSLEIESSAASCKTSSGASMFLTGKSEILAVNSSSGSSFKGIDCECQTSSAEASSGAEISINAVKTLAAHASSGASILYKGKPETLTKNSSSGGEIRGL